MAAKTRFIKWQKTKEIITKKKYKGESSPYWDAMARASRARAHHDTTGETNEYPTSNPDMLEESEPPQENLLRKILKRDWREIKFSKREKEVLLLLANGLTQDAVAKCLNIKRSTVQTMVKRIQKKSFDWYVIKMANSSIYSTEEESE